MTGLKTPHENINVVRFEWAALALPENRVFEAFTAESNKIKSLV